MVNWFSLTIQTPNLIRRISSKLRDCREMAAPISPFQIILGSSSIARRRILSEMGYKFTIMTADIDEKAIRKERPEELVMALAEAKADAIMSRILATGVQLDNNAPPTLLITADTLCRGCVSFVMLPLFLFYGTIREKPSNKDEARKFIKGYSGSHASVVSSVLITNLKTGTRKGGWEEAEVYFYDIPVEIIDNLIEEDVTFKVAGGLMLEHPLTLPLVEAVVGSTDTVMGLPKALTEKLMNDAL
ncbi:7-methyl-GTP pyrophosphatase-like isoform X1 [Benincasa hispida]|uniref:7-methyl-GTP pyrophosphatase-like isoform X1 n=1 Tax=Benincasa hispida TaxID=102211 RepID=UPI001901F2E4|nr:7-methyl-GTP pyrophosphatase-like isoform X1 [Benincasa hispida]XP_038875891.1 7-methyl-GTP pyrophosphatase-like isoform X1 [Benincasa hispida]